MPVQSPKEPRPAVARRDLLREGAVLAGAATITAAGAALSTPAAHAANGDPLVLGRGNDAESATGLTIGGADGDSEAALAVTNVNGPSLYLNPLPRTWEGELSEGQIANTVDGPFVGVEGWPSTTKLLTEQDIWWPFILSHPYRLVDTRTEEGRFLITEPSPLAKDGRLPAGKSMTIVISGAEDGFLTSAVHLNITVVGPTAPGYVVVYPGPDRPPTSTVNFQRGQTLANAAFVGTSVGDYVVQDEEVSACVIHLHTTAAAWIVVDSTGGYAVGYNPYPSPDESAGRSGRLRRMSPATLAQRSFGKV